MSRVILHCDCNSFFASVETVLNPDYRNVPMAVCGSQEDRRGIVLAKNELAKKYNITTAETIYSALKKCPNLVIAKPHYEQYEKYSILANEIYSRYTDTIEPFGIDESWLDVTKSQKLFGSGYQIAEQIRKTVKEELGITVSIGVSFNKCFAKLGSDYKKPDAITVIDEEHFKDIVFPLPVSSLLFVGSKTAEVLRHIGIRTIGELAGMNVEILKNRLGKAGEMLHAYANGNDNSPVAKNTEDRKSISSGLTFKHDLIKPEEYRTAIDYLSSDIGTKLRKNSQLASTVSITVKDEFLQSIQRQRIKDPPTDISSEISNLAYEILKDTWIFTKPIRMITVSVSNLVRREQYTKQISIFDGQIDKKREINKKRETTIDKIKEKYGASSIINASLLNNDIGIDTGKE